MKGIEVNIISKSFNFILQTREFPHLFVTRKYDYVKLYFLIYNLKTLKYCPKINLLIIRIKTIFKQIGIFTYV